MSGLLAVEGLRVEIGGRAVVSGVDLALDRGGTLGIVGPSGCGKSMTALAVLGLLPEDARVSGKIMFDGVDLNALDARQRRGYGGTRIGMVFQEPMTALNPVLTVGVQMTETLIVRQGMAREAARARAVEMLAAVGFAEPRRALDQYPHELSGGMRQRAMIGMALAPQPDLLIADEPTTALDVSIQAQILNLLIDLREARPFALMLISHDPRVVSALCDRIIEFDLREARNA